MKHPDPARLSAYGLGRLDDVQSAEIETHLGECEECLATVATVPPDDPLVSLFRTAASAPPAEPDTRAFLSHTADTETYHGGPPEYKFLAPPANRR